MAAAVAHLESANHDGHGGKADHPWGTERGAETSGKAGHREHGEQQNKQRNKADGIFNRATRGVGQKGLYGGFHGVLPTCCLIVLMSGNGCKELFKNK
jgi:hypothetical protein